MERNPERRLTLLITVSPGSWNRKRSFGFLIQRVERVGFCQVLAFFNPPPPVEFILLFLILFLLK